MANRAKKRFYLIKRRNRRSEGKAIYYCRIRGSDGNLLPWKSTGQTTKSAVENWALDHLDEIASVRKTLTFKEYAEGWWMPDCQYLVRKAARGSPVAPSYADVARSYLSRHILPRFGSEHLGSITSHSIDAWAMSLKDQLSPATANRCLAILRVMLREATRQGLITTNPAAAVQQLRETPKERGIPQSRIESGTNALSCLRQMKLPSEDLSALVRLLQSHYPTLRSGILNQRLGRRMDRLACCIHPL